jgi:transposase
MAIVAGFDVHRAQITFDALDTKTGEVSRGRIDATPAAVARWLARFAGQQIDVAVEACTGLAVRVRRARGRGRGPALSRAGRDARVAGPQAARQDRS